MRVLVLSSSTGSGHDMRARAFAAWVERLYGKRVEVRIEQVIENGSLLGRFGVWLYNRIHRHAPWLHNLYFFIVEAFVRSHSRRVTFGGRYYRQLLADWPPEVVFSVHDSTNRGYFEDARRILGPAVRCGTYCGEFSGGFGYSANWVNPSADFFIARTERARQHAVQLGLPIERSSVFQKLLPPDAFASRLSETDRRRFLEDCGLEPGRFTLFLATGGYGANHHLAFLRAVLPLADSLQVIAVCGNNRRILGRVRRWARRHPALGLFAEGFSTRMAACLQVADAVVTRGGANTTMEALHFDCPLLYDCLGGLMPQEQCTVRYFLDHRAARLIRRPADLTACLRDWSRGAGDYPDIRARLRELHVEEHPAGLLDRILGGPLS